MKLTWKSIFALLCVLCALQASNAQVVLHHCPQAVVGSPTWVNSCGKELYTTNPVSCDIAGFTDGHGVIVIVGKETTNVNVPTFTGSTLIEVGHTDNGSGRTATMYKAVAVSGSGTKTVSMANAGLTYITVFAVEVANMTDVDTYSIYNDQFGNSTFQQITTTGSSDVVLAFGFDRVTGWSYTGASFSNMTLDTNASELSRGSMVGYLNGRTAGTFTPATVSRPNTGQRWNVSVAVK